MIFISIYEYIHSINHQIVILLIEYIEIYASVFKIEYNLS